MEDRWEWWAVGFVEGFVLGLEMGADEIVVGIGGVAVDLGGELGFGVFAADFEFGAVLGFLDVLIILEGVGAVRIEMEGDASEILG